MYSDYSTFIVFAISIITNYVFSMLIKKVNKWNKLYFLIPVIINIAALLYYKYIDFAIINMNKFVGSEFRLKELILPLGISFFSFQQIAYLVAIYRQDINENSLLDYLVYILYFPKILMGPLIEPVEFVSQLNESDLKKVNWDNMASGVKVFSFGLFKKLMIADVFSIAVSWGFNNVESATSLDWILVMLFYTFEIYFDFSGYSDMAVGTSLMLNIELPINFDSPYKALSIRDFWKRWHISLTRFFTKYIYIPLGGSKKGKILTYVNTMVVFFISGLWHGADWNFIFWGVLHGLFMVFDRVLEKVQKKIPKAVKWTFTFMVVNILWLLFRADSIGQWIMILTKVSLLNNMTVSEGLIELFRLPESIFLSDIFHLNLFINSDDGFWMILYIIIALGICLITENNYRNAKKLSIPSMLLATVAFVWGFISLSGESVFVYFNF